MKTNIQIFKNEMFGEIRTLTNEKGEALFCLKDLCSVLELQSKQVVRRLDDEVFSKHPIFDKLGRRQKTWFVNEDGLYDVILDSRKPEARAFRKWITSEVLPQIRMTGGYIPTKDADGRQLTDAEIVDRAHGIIGRTLELVNCQNADCLTATQVAQLWGMEVHSFNNLLKSMGIQHRKGGRWQLSPELQNCGLAEERLFCFYSLKGKPRTQRYLVWTPEGVRFLDMAVRKLPRDGGPMTSVQLNIVFNA